MTGRVKTARVYIIDFFLMSKDAGHSGAGL